MSFVKLSFKCVLVFQYIETKIFLQSRKLWAVLFEEASSAIPVQLNFNEEIWIVICVLLVFQCYLDFVDVCNKHIELFFGLVFWHTFVWKLSLVKDTIICVNFCSWSWNVPHDEFLNFCTLTLQSWSADLSHLNFEF